MERHIKTDDGVGLWINSSGRGPDLTLAHGGPGLWDYMAPLATMMDPFATVYRWDQRGNGRSDPVGPYTVDRFVRDMDVIRDAVGIERWVAGGHSWGAALSLLYAIRYPARTTGVLYIAGTGLDPTDWKPAYKREFERRLGPEGLQRFHEGSSEAELNRLRWTTEYATPEAAAPEVDRMIAQGFAVNQECNQSIGRDMTANSEDYFMSLEDLHVPVLIIQGSLDPRPLSVCDSLESRLPYAERVILDAGHFPWVEQPNAFLDAVSAWMARL